MANEHPKRRLKLPHTLVLISLLLLGVYILGLIPPVLTHWGPL